MIKSRYLRPIGMREIYAKINVINITFYILIFVLFSFQAFAQSRNDIQGCILNKDKKAVEFATISLLNASDSSLVKGTLTDSSGNFRISNIPSETYVLYISHIEHKPYYQKIQVNVSQVILPTVILDFSSTKLDEIVVKGSRTLIERKIDRVIFNVEKSIMASTGNALDAVSKSPGVRIDFQGNVTVNGKSARVLINNRPLHLSPAELNNYLKNITAQNIQHVEIMSNPSSAYDAKSGAIINIVTKKRTQQGVYGSLNASYQQGQAGRSLIGGKLIYNRGRFRISNSYTFRDATYRKQFLEENSYQVDGANKFWSTDRQEEEKGQTHLYKLNMDYALSKRHVVGAQFVGSYSQRNTVTQTDNNVYSQQVLDSNLTTGETSGANKFRYALNLNYEGKLGNKGSQINVNFNYLNYTTDWNQDLNTNTLGSSGEPLTYAPRSQSQSERLITLKTGNVDYKLPLGKQLVVKMGAKLNYITTDNDFGTQNLLNNVYVNDTSKTNHFIYTENTQAFYANMDWKLKKHQLQLGLRGEATQTKGESVSLSAVNTQNYMQLFPSVYWLYAPNDKRSLSFSYRRGITRPGYWRVNPFRFYTTPVNYMVGNPALRPMIEDAFELTYTFGGQYSITGFYNGWKDEHLQVVVQDSDTQSYHFEQINQDQSFVYGAYLTLPYQITPWWEVNAYLQVAQTTARSNYLNTSYNNSQWNFYGSVSNSFVLSKKGKLTAEISAWYSSPDVQGFYHLFSNYDVSIGLRKVFAKGRMALAVAVSDMFYSQPTRLESVQENQLYKLKNMQDTQTVRVSFYYRFKKGKVKQPRRRNSGNEDEKQRIKD